MHLRTIQSHTHAERQVARSERAMQGCRTVQNGVESRRESNHHKNARPEKRRSKGRVALAEQGHRHRWLRACRTADGREPKSNDIVQSKQSMSVVLDSQKLRNSDIAKAAYTVVSSGIARSTARAFAVRVDEQSRAGRRRLEICRVESS